MKTGKAGRWKKDTLWLTIWIAGIAALGIWDALFLNRPAFEQIQSAFGHSALIALMALAAAVFLGWAAGVGLYFLEGHPLALPIQFLLNLIRSVPQIVGILAGYVLITFMMRRGALHSEMAIMVLMAFSTGLFIFLELADLIRERIDYYRSLDFVDAMRCCGIPESRIVHVEILWKNSMAHILNKLIALFGMAIFLQCSVDFIISVGLSTDVSPVNLPVTLGSMLARIDSKQDILAIGYTLTDPAYF